jgi:serine/threonine-protein kinase
VRPQSHGDQVAPHEEVHCIQEAIGGLDPVDDPDEATFPEPTEPEDEPTTIRPSPLPASLALREVSVVRNSGRGFAASLGGRVGKYELRHKLGRGAFGVVFTARDPSLDRDVAIKVLRPSHLTNSEIVQRFLQEARATARITHPGIVTIHDCGRVETGSGSTAFIAMELLSGESLTSRLLRCGRLAPGTAAEIARQVASALEAAHRAAVLHRDLKPDNIYIVPDPAMPSGERVKVLDFGLAKLGQEGNTQLQTVFGTPRYMSPEQCRSAAQVDHRSDIYALGCILFELVTGRLVFDGDVRQLIERHQFQAPPRATSVVPELSPALDALIGEMLAKDPLERPQTMGAVQRALHHAITIETPVIETGLPRPGLPRPGETWAIGTDPATAPELSRPAELQRPPEPPRPPELSRSCEHPRPPRSASEAPPEASLSMRGALDVEDTAKTPTTFDPGALSGEILVPATGTNLPSARAPSGNPAAPRRRRALLVCMGTLALIVLVILALISIA